MIIGKTNIPHGLLLAPLAGVSDAAFRRICARHGAEYTVSEMLSAKALCYEQRCRKRDISLYKTASIAAIGKDDVPTAVQIFGSEPEFMAEAARMLAERSYLGCLAEQAPAAIDINMGCPVHKVVSNGEGSALMKDPELCSKIIRAVAGAVDIPVTVKIRAGWDKDSINAVEIAKRAEDAGAAAVCVHARTRSQMYAPGVDVRIIGEVKRAISIPVIGNGDIFSPEDARRMLDETGCDGLMIARGALGNPWIFEQIRTDMEGEDFVLPSENERIITAIEHFDAMLAEKGEKVGFAEAKKHMAWYTKGMRGSAEIRNGIMNSESADETRRLLSSLIQTE